jgi:tRNA/rRNA methyltransferase
MNTPAIILMAPQMGENIGATARAMANFGLSDLRLVAPRDGWPNERAEAMSAGALDLMQISVFDTLKEALADCHFVLATTARPRDMVKEIYTPHAAVSHIRGHALFEGKSACPQTAFLFGRERNGLENEEIALCQGIITVPTAEAFASINLGQSVLLLCYEWFQAEADKDAQQFHKGDSDIAVQKDVQQFNDRLIAALEEGGFFRSEGLKPHMVKNITNMIARQNWTAQEMNTWQGILSALVKSWE